MPTGATAWKGLAALAAMILATPATAVERPAVVELFTSQGCSSCPPADALIRDIARDRRDVLALSFPVDIWDYIGWKDTLARPEFTARQKHYAQSRGDHQVYTPQIVVDGAVHGVGSDKQQLAGLVESTAGARHKLGATMKISEMDGMVVVDLGASGSDIGHGAGVWLLRVARSKSVSIGRGENSGRQLTYANVVRSMVRMGQWMGGPSRFEIPLPEARADDADGYVVIVQKSWGDVLGPILAAGKSDGL
ncbi:MAG: hypothetical protein JWN07_2189 [Hyphomicrobiales bacterium]|nr:hypothetical protein [Hyphomicrobiales bacterium]